MQLQPAYHVFMTHGAAERLYAKETLTKHEDVFRSWIFPFLQDREVENIDRRDILEFRARMVGRGLGIYPQYQIRWAAARIDAVAGVRVLAIAHGICTDSPESGPGGSPRAVRHVAAAPSRVSDEACVVSSSSLIEIIAQIERVAGRYPVRSRPA